MDGPNQRERARGGAAPTVLTRLAHAGRPAMHLWWRLSRGLTLGVRGIVLDGAGRVLLVRHTYLPGLHLPGGGVEPGETTQVALARELAEEARVVLLGPAEPHGLFHNPRGSARDHVMVYVVRAFRVEGPRAPDAEILEAAFHPLGALPADTAASTRARIAEVAGGAARAEIY